VQSAFKKTFGNYLTFPYNPPGSKTQPPFMTMQGLKAVSAAFNKAFSG
jgi:hypothetical protein